MFAGALTRRGLALAVAVSHGAGRWSLRGAAVLFAIALALTALNVIRPVPEACTQVGAQPLVCQVARGFSARLVIFDVCVLAYLAAWRSPRARGHFLGAAGFRVHAGWTIAAFGWLLYTLFSSLVDVGGYALLELLRVLPPLVLAIACFVQGTNLGANRPVGSPPKRWVAALFAVGFLTLMLVQVAADRLVNYVVQTVQLAHDRAVLAAELFNLANPYENRAKPPPGFWMTDPVSSSLLNSLLDNTPWLLLGGMYALTSVRSDALSVALQPGLVSVRPLRSLGQWFSQTWVVVYAWVPIVVAGLLVLSTTLVTAAWVDAPPAAIGPASRVFGLVLAYAILLVPSLAAAVRLWRSPFDVPPATPADETAARDALVERWLPVAWLLFIVGALVAGNTLLIQHAVRGWPSLDISLRSHDNWPLETIPGGALGADFVAFAGVAFFALIVQYVLAVELPYFRGQRLWKRATVARCSTALRAAEAELSRYVAHPGPFDQEGGRAVGAYHLALEQARRAREIPVHYVRTLSGLIAKLSEKAGVALLAAIVGSQGGGAFVQTIAGWLAEWALGGLLGG